MSFKPIMVMNQIDLVDVGYPMIPTTSSEDDFVVFRNRYVDDRVDLVGSFLNLEDEQKIVGESHYKAQAALKPTNPVADNEVRPSNYDGKLRQDTIKSVTETFFDVNEKNHVHLIATLKAPQVKSITTEWKELKAKKSSPATIEEWHQKNLLADTMDLKKKIMVEGVRVTGSSVNYKSQLLTRDESGAKTGEPPVMTPIVVKSGGTGHVKVVE